MQALDRQAGGGTLYHYRVWDYVYSCFEALHTTGANYIVEDIDLYIEAKETGYDLRLRMRYAMR